MIRTAQELLYAYMLIFWLLKNCYMAVTLQIYKRLYTAASLALMFVLNALFILLAYVLGSVMLIAHSVLTVLCISVTFVCLLECIFWYVHGAAQEIKGIICAQICVAGTLYILYMLGHISN